MIPVVALIGCTASGKSALALATARRLEQVEIVSVDSMQVYRGMDIGTAKPSPQEQAEVTHHCIDLVGADENYTVARYQRDCRAAVADIVARGKRPLLVGGTGLYAQAVLDGFDIPGRYPTVRAEVEAEPDTEALHRRLAELDPEAAGRMEPSNRRRVVRALEVTVGAGRPFSTFGPGVDRYEPDHHLRLGVQQTRKALDERIEERYRRQMADGFVDEVRALASQPRGLSRSARQALGYRELLAHVEEEAPLDECLDEAVTRTRRFARRQDRWFRRDPRITWMDGGQNSSTIVDALVRHCETFVETREVRR